MLTSPGLLILGATVALRLLKRRSLTGHLFLRLYSLAVGAGACCGRAEALDFKVENADSPGCSCLPKRHVMETEAGKACLVMMDACLYLNDHVCNHTPMPLQPIIIWEAAQWTKGKELRVSESERMGLAASPMEGGYVIYHYYMKDIERQSLKYQ